MSVVRDGSALVRSPDEELVIEDQLGNSKGKVKFPATGLSEETRCKQGKLVTL